MPVSEEVAFNIRARDNASRVMDRVGGKLGVLRKEGLAVGAGFAGANIAIATISNTIQGFIQYVQQAAETYRTFEHGLTKVGTLLESKQLPILKDLKSEIIDISILYAQSFDDLLKAEYDIVSAGVDIQHSMEVLSASSRLANIGISSVTEAADAITSAMNAYNMSVSQADMLASKYQTTIEKGKITMTGLQQALQYTLPVASKFGYSLDETLTAIAELTKLGTMPSMAGRQLRQLMAQIAAPTEEARKVMSELGVVWDDVTIKGRGLYGILQLISEATEGLDHKIRDIVGSTEAMSAAMGLMSSETYTESLADIGSDIDKSYQKMFEYMDSPQFKADQRKAIKKSWELFRGENANEVTESVDYLSMYFERAFERLLSGQWEYAFVYAMKDIEAYKTKYQNIMKGFAETAKTESISDMAGGFEALSKEISDQDDIIKSAQINIARYTTEISDLREEMQHLTEVHNLQDDLYFANLALENSIYKNRIYDQSLAALTDSIRQQENAIEKLKNANDRYNMAMRSGNIEALKIQLAASKRRGRYTRDEEERLKVIEQNELKYRIKTLQNQQNIDKIKQGGLNKDIKQYEKKITAMQVYLREITSTYESEIEALKTSISIKQQLIEQDTEDMNRALKRKYATMKFWHKKFYSLPPDVRASVFAELPGGIPEGVMGIQQLNKNVYRKLGIGEFMATGGKTTVDVKPISINVNVTDGRKDTTSDIVKKIQAGIRQGIISGVSTIYG